MSKSHETLVEDIYSVVKDKVDTLDEGLLDDSLQSLKALLHYRLEKRHIQEANQLRMSNYGTGCLRKLWYHLHSPEDATPIEPWVHIKFLYGDLLEWLFLFLAKVAGHKVEGEQTTLQVGNVVGHRDAIIDGLLVDVKSANSRSFDKFKYHEVPKNDAFGYMDQIALYHHASKPELEIKDKAAFLAVDKEMGHVVLDVYSMPERDLELEVKKKSELLESSEPPERGYKPEPHNKSGNMALPLACKYCSFRQVCHPGLRTFLYSSGPVYMTKVVKEPDVKELK